MSLPRLWSQVSEFGKPWGADTVSSTGEGVTLVAAALLAAALTRDLC
jgi:hypothetical protein